MGAEVKSDSLSSVKPMVFSVILRFAFGYDCLPAFIAKLFLSIEIFMSLSLLLYIAVPFFSPILTGHIYKSYIYS